MTTTAAKAPRYRILELHVENFLGVEIVDLTPDAHVQVISGANGAGKSSVLDSIVYTLASARKMTPPKLPVRSGAKTGKVSVLLGDDGKPAFRVTRTWTTKEDKLAVELVVSSPDGKADYRSPVTYLADALGGDVTWDPGAFALMAEKEQAAVLRRLVPALDMTDLDLAEDRLRAERTCVGRERDLLEGQHAGVKVPAPPEGESPVFLDTKALAVQRKEIDARRAGTVEASLLVDGLNRDVARVHTDINDLTARLKELLEQHTILTTRAADASKALEEMAPLATLAEQAAAIDAQMSEATAQNSAATAWRGELRSHEEGIAAQESKGFELKGRKDRYAALTAEIEKIAEEKRKRIAGATMPLPGLALKGDAVTVNGVPVSQLSSAQQLRLGCEIGARVNGNLCALTMKHGSLIDDEGMAFLVEWTRERDMQLFIERVGKCAGGIVIVDGKVAAPSVVEKAPEVPATVLARLEIAEVTERPAPEAK